MKTILYTYFGQLGTNFKEDIPGHMFYQVPLIESLKYVITFDKVDFYSYLDYNTQEGYFEFPDTKVGELLKNTMDDLLDKYCPTYNEILSNIANEKYEYLVLKARFRNLSTLSKKMTDAYQFESIILHALECGYSPEKIIVLDTDLSMPKNFTSWLKKEGIRILIPSIDFAPMSKNFAKELLTINANRRVLNDAIYYGNLSFGNYKKGHSKNNIVNDCIHWLHNVSHFEENYCLTIAGKVDNHFKNIHIIPRTEREKIWFHFESARLCLNVSKDLYCERKFVPARVYESLLFGVIPVSYNMPYIYPAMSFDNIEQFEEIAKFILELSQDDYYSIYSKVLQEFILDK